MPTLSRTSLVTWFPLLFVLYEVANYLSNDMYLPALPEMMRELHITPAEAQLTLTAWFLGQATTPLLVGVLADHWGRRRVLLWGGLIYIISTIVCAIANSLPILLGARFIEGACVATMLVPGYAVIHETYQQKEAVRILALMGSISVLAPALGPLVGSIALLYTDWRGIFWMIAMAASLLLLLLVKWMPETQRKDEGRAPFHVKTLASQYGRLLLNRPYMFQIFTLGFIFSGFLAWVTASPLLVMQTFSHTALTFGFIQAGIFGAYIVGSHLVKFLLEKMHLKMLIRVGMSTALTGSLLCVIASICFPNIPSLFLVTMAVYSLGSALCFAPLNRGVIESSEEPMGARIALFAVFMTAFAALGSAASSVFFNGSALSLSAILASVMIISGIFMLTTTAK